MSFGDTIAAISTAPGRAALAVVRVSGPEVRRVVSRLALGDLVPRRATYRRLRHPDDGRVVDHVVATMFASPASYTGEDMLEVSCHGGAVVPQLVLDAVCAAGARHADAGEFTRRALLGGKLDLLQAEATLDLVDARSEALQQAALFQLDRGLSRRIEAMRASLLELQGLLAYDIDFPDEDDGPVSEPAVAAATADVLARLEELLVLAPEGELLRDGALTVIAGRPNVGKSSLFNALLGTERAIVTEVPGTTRDAIEAVVSLSGYPFRLVDTAGLRQQAERIEELGIEVARRYLSRADLILFCVEDGRELGGDEREFLHAIGVEDESAGDRVVLVRTKADLPDGGARKPDRDENDGVRVATLTGEGLSDLRERLLQLVFGNLRIAEETPLVTRERHVRQLRLALRAVQEFEEARRKRHPAEVAATHLQEATLHLEELLGIVTTEDVLDVVFRSFCVGK